MGTDGDEQLEGVCGERGRACVCAYSKHVYLCAYADVSKCETVPSVFGDFLPLFIDRDSRTETENL